MPMYSAAHGKLATIGSRNSISRGGLLGAEGWLADAEVLLLL